MIDRHTQTDRKTYSQRQTYAQRQTHRHGGICIVWLKYCKIRQTHRSRFSDRQPQRQSDNRRDRQPQRQTDNRRNRQTAAETGKNLFADREAKGRTQGQTVNHTETNAHTDRLQ